MLGCVNPDAAQRMLRDHAGVDVAEMRAALDRVFDDAVVFHGYVDYLRDYDLFIVVATSEPVQCLRYRFVGCVQANTTSALGPSALPHLLDERLLEGEQAGQTEGYQGVKWQCLYPGMTLVPDSAEAARWSHDTGVTMVEAVMETSV